MKIRRGVNQMDHFSIFGTSLMTFIAVTPILWLLVSLGGLKVPAQKACELVWS
ncbi:hypothetical protein SOV_32560 [Sporomusa ovata DSM 2662]|nr:hypothetical protein SOV_5c03610 [Sporomusa ovata DSM 2662]